MNGDIFTLDYLNNPNTVDFVVRNNKSFIDYARTVPEIRVVKPISEAFLLGYTDREHIEGIMENIEMGYYSLPSLVLGLLGTADLNASGITAVQEQELGLKGSGVLIGFVDTGIDYTNVAFRNEDGTSRIYSIYDQTVSGTHPYNNVIGHEFTNDEINRALQSSSPYEIVPHRDTVGHGTFLASVAGGSRVGDFSGAAPESELIVVKLKKAGPYYLEKYLVPPEQDNVFQCSDVMIGVEYIVNKARELNRPVAICIGVGTNLGYHDGYGVFEEYLTSVAQMTGVCLCTAAGNERLAGHHTHGAIERAGESKDIRIRVEGTDVARNNIYITIRNSFSDLMSVAVISPLGEIVGRAPARRGAMLTSLLSLSKGSVSIEYHFPFTDNNSQETVIRILNAQPGIWTINLYGDIVLDGTFHAFLPLRGLGFPGIQFVESSPDYTIVVPSTCTGSISCAAYESVNNELYLDSSWGPTLLPILKPDLAAPGVNVAGHFPEGYGSMSGTSVSSAIVAGACALMLQWGIVDNNYEEMSTYQIRSFLISGCIQESGLFYPNTQWGYGRFNLKNTFDIMQL